MSPALPVHPDTLAEQGIAAANAGAAILHVHARDPRDGRPTPEVSAYLAFLPRLKDGANAVINVTTGGGMSMTVDDRLRAPAQLRPEMCSLNMGSMNFAIYPLADRYQSWKYEWDEPYLRATEDAVFVGKLSESQKVGAMVKALKARPETLGITEIHKTAYRPWGGYSSVLNGARFQVKKLFVKPGAKLSLQKHHHRAEHWVVVAGTAEVTIDGKVSTVNENESIYLPLGCVHRLANPGKILLEVIEVQTGSYLGEDDIIRIEDEFGRA